MLFLIAAYHIAGICFGTLAVGFPNILKRYKTYSLEFASRMPREDVQFRSRRGDELHGWLFRNPGTDKTVLLCHGRSRNKSHELPYAKDFAECYNVMVFDFVGHGASPFRPTSIGYNESADVLGALDWLGSHGFTNIAVMGHSMGGAAAIKAASEYAGGPATVRCLVTEGAFARLDDLLLRQARLYLLAPTVWWPSFRIAELLGGYRIAENAPEKFIAGVRCPVLILQAEADHLSPPDSPHRLASNAGGPAEVVIFKGHHDRPCSEVSARTMAFLRHHL